MINKNLPPIGFPLQPTRPPRLLSGMSGAATYPPATTAVGHVGRGHPSPNQGFAMLFSVLISSLLVVIGLSIFNITLKELTISTSARESQIAFYAANSGMECALYWDLTQNAFATTTNASKNTPEDARVGAITANCNGVDVNNTYSKSGVKTETSALFPVILSTDTEGPCADITVTKEEDSDGKIITTIESQGKNICGTSGRRVERGLRAVIKRD
ncbi:MAG: seg [Parcubacteria group bacterium]|nr:seg [Parcubacteria group bacterium]